jgi:hypothetical protein
MPAGERLLVDAQVLDRFRLAAGQSAADRPLLNAVYFVPAQTQLVGTSAVKKSAMRLNRIPADVWLLSSEAPTSEKNSAARAQLIVLIAGSGDSR